MKAKKQIFHGGTWREWAETVNAGVNTVALSFAIIFEFHLLLVLGSSLAHSWRKFRLNV